MHSVRQKGVHTVCEWTWKGRGRSLKQVHFSNWNTRSGSVVSIPSSYSHGPGLKSFPATGSYVWDIAHFPLVQINVADNTSNWVTVSTILSEFLIILTRLRYGHPRNCSSVSSRGKRSVSSPTCPDLLWSPTSLLLNGRWALSPGIKWPGREADYSISCRG
jgi:hypothetical protein